MNKKTKLLLAVLSASCLAAGTLGLVGCGDKSTNTNPQDGYHAAYALYTAYAESQGDTPASYEAWLAAIKGEKGDKGDKGDQGNGIESVEISYESMAIVITYTDGTTDEIPLEIEEPSHDYGNLVVVSEPTETKEGLGYKECDDEGCGALQHVKFHAIVDCTNDNRVDFDEAGVYTFKVPVLEGTEGAYAAVFFNFEGYYWSTHSYKLKVYDPNVLLEDKDKSFVLSKGDDKAVFLSVNAAALEGKTEYLIRVEVEDTYIDEGESMDSAYELNLNTVQSDWADENEWVYFVYDGTNMVYSEKKVMLDGATFKFSKNVEMEIVGAYVEENHKTVYKTIGEKITSGTAVTFPADYEKVYVRAKSVDNEVIFASEAEEADYVVTLKAPTGSEDVTLKGMQVAFTAQDVLVGVATADADGKVKATLPNLDYTVSLYEATAYTGTATIAKGTKTADLQLSKAADATVTGASSVKNAPAVTTGTTMITNSGYVKFEVEEAATYTFSMKYSYFKNVYDKQSSGSVPVTFKDDEVVKDSNGNITSFTIALERGKIIVIRNAQPNDILTITKVAGSEPTPVDPVDPTPTTSDLTVGENTITISDGYWGTKLTFAPSEGGWYKISSEDEDALVSDSSLDNYYISVADDVTDYTFYLEAGASIEFTFLTTSQNAGEYTVKIEESEEPSTSNTLSEGDNIVNATYAGASYTFTAEEGGTYTISWTSSNAWPMNSDEETLGNGDEFTLEAGASITFIFSTTTEGDDTYTVTISPVTGAK